MSGQFTESCRTLVETNRNQCRDSLQSLVGPLKSRTLKRCAQSVKRRAIKRRAQSIKRRAIKSCALKRRAHFIKSRARQKASSHQKVSRRRGEARERQCACRPLRHVLYKSMRRLRQKTC
ncbi:unnamed protein product [Camellia sinensis]